MKKFWKEHRKAIIGIFIAAIVIELTSNFFSEFLPIPLYNFLNSSFPVSGWVLVVIIISGLAIPLIILLVKKQLNKSLKDYTSDELLGIKWEFILLKNGKIFSDSLTPICPYCNSEMTLIGGKKNTIAYCRNFECGFSKEFHFDKNGLKNQAKILIERNAGEKNS